METLDDIFDTEITQEIEADAIPEKKEFDKEAWIEKKKAEREAAYELRDIATLEAVSEEGMFKTYLDVQSKFDHYSVGNAMMITNQMPLASKLKDYDGWKNAGAYVRKSQTPIVIFEPGNEYLKPDGTIGTSYNVKKLFDASQTNAYSKAQQPKEQDARTLLVSLINSGHIKTQGVNELPGGQIGAMYDHENNVVLVSRGMDSPDIFRNLTREIAHAKFAQNDKAYSRDERILDANAVSYILCRKHGIGVNGFDFSDVSDIFFEMEPGGIRSEISRMNDMACEMEKNLSRTLNAAKGEKSDMKER
ncbi:MAG: hypothetical protein RSD35_09070 [Oscillospiraceae bacterium]